MPALDRKSTRLNSSHLVISYAVFCLKKINQPERYVALAAGLSTPEGTLRQRDLARAVAFRTGAGAEGADLDLCGRRMGLFFLRRGRCPDFPLFPQALDSR